MQNSSAFCRTQQSNEAQRAAESPLANVQALATRAAAAWGIEASSAERREERQVRRQTEGATLPAVGEERSLSENPDRDFADRF